MTSRLLIRADELEGVGHPVMLSRLGDSPKSLLIWPEGLRVLLSIEPHLIRAHAPLPDDAPRGAYVVEAARPHA